MNPSPNRRRLAAVFRPFAEASRPFQILLIILAAYFALRVAVNFVIHAGLAEGSGLDPATVSLWMGKDLRVVTTASDRLRARENLYTPGAWGAGRIVADPEHPFLSAAAAYDEYNYTPFYALAIAQITAWIPFPAHAVAHAAVTLLAYIALFASWQYLFRRLELPTAADAMIGLLPVWLVYTAWWGDFGLLNIYILLCLAVTWLFYFLYRDWLWRSALLLIAVLQVKPQWAFALALPLILGRYRFFFRLAAAVTAGYLAVAVATVAMLGASYGLAQYGGYVHMLATAGFGIPWSGQGAPIGYDHSVAQVIFHFTGYDPAYWPLVWGVKAALLIPLAVVALRRMRAAEGAAAGIALEIFFALYLAAFIWLDLVWELTLSIVVFAYLHSVLRGGRIRSLVMIPFFAYALVDLWQLASFSFMDLEEFNRSGPPIWIDPSYHLPLILVALLTAYSVLVVRLWNHPAPAKTTASGQRAVQNLPPTNSAG